MKCWKFAKAGNVPINHFLSAVPASPANRKKYSFPKKLPALTVKNNVK